jgi:hypothetical protein
MLILIQLMTRLLLLLLLLLMMMMMKLLMRQGLRAWLVLVAWAGRGSMLHPYSTVPAAPCLHLYAGPHGRATPSIQAPHQAPHPCQTPQRLCLSSGCTIALSSRALQVEQPPVLGAVASPGLPSAGQR